MNFNRPSRLYITESLKVHLGIEDRPIEGTRKDSIGYYIERFTADKLQYFREKCPIINVHQLDSEVLCQLSEDYASYLAARDIVLKINTQRLTKDE